MSKKKTPRDPKYLRWITTKSCCKCGSTRNVVAHHAFTGGIGIKCSDYLSLPLCAIPCHNEVHMVGVKTFWEGFDREKLTHWYRSEYEKARALINKQANID